MNAREEDMLKKYDINKVKKPWSITLDGKTLARNVLYLGIAELPEFLMQNYVRPSNKLIRPNNSIVDENIRQKVKKSIIKELLSLGYKYEPKHIRVKDNVTIINNVTVRIKRIPRKGWAVIIDRRKSTDIDRDTIKVQKFLEKKGIKIKDENICPTYCINKKIVEK